MPIITLTTDLGTVDHYVSAVKATIIRQLENVNIIDISHDIPTFNIIHAAFVLKNVYQDFPSGTIHIIGVNTETDKDCSHLIVYANEHYFIGSDNGIFSLILENLDVNSGQKLKPFSSSLIFFMTSLVKTL